MRFTDARAPRNRTGLEPISAPAIMAAWTGWKARKDERADPQALWQGAKSVMVLGLNYGPAAIRWRSWRSKDRGAISAYAQGDDYHDLVKKKLKAVAGYIFESNRPK